MKHSPTPWRVDHNKYDGEWRVYCGSDEGSLPPVINSLFRGKDGEADARHIVHCVNNHDDLVDALSTLVRVLDETGIETLGCGLARAVLKKAKGVVTE